MCGVVMVGWQDNQNHAHSEPHTKLGLELEFAFSSDINFHSTMQTCKVSCVSFACDITSMASPTVY